jgi:hypothetical protein
MYQIYTDAAKFAVKFAEQSDKLALLAKNEEDKYSCEDYANMARRFAAKANKAAEKTLTMLNDGTLKEYCKEFDKVFEQFVKNVENAEKEQAKIEING